MSNWLYQFLRRGQKYTGTDNVYLAKGGIWLTLGQVISLGASFLLAVAFANLLTPTAYGNYKYVLSLLGMLGIFSLVDMRTAVAQATACHLEGSFYSGFKTQLRWGALGSLVAIGAAVYYWFRGNEVLPIPLLISAIFLPLMQASQICGGFLMGKKLFDIWTRYNIVKQIISAGAIVTALFFTKNLLWLVVIYLVSHTFLNYFFYLLTKFKFRPNKKESPETLNYGKHLSLMGVISFVGSYLDKILLFTLAGSTQLAIYSFAMIFPEQINNIAQNINTLAFPKLAQKSREEIKATIMKKLWKLCFLAAIIIILYIIIAPYFYKIFFPQYLSAVPYSQALIFSLVSLPTSLLGTAFQAKMMKRELYLLRIVVASVRIMLFLVLIPLYGIWGVIIAYLGAEVFSSAFALFLSRRI